MLDFLKSECDIIDIGELQENELLDFFEGNILEENLDMGLLKMLTGDRKIFTILNTGSENYNNKIKLLMSKNSAYFIV